MSIYSNHNYTQKQQSDNHINQQSLPQNQNIFFIYSSVSTNNKIRYTRNLKIHDHFILMFLFLVVCSYFPRLIKCDCAQSSIIQTMFIEKNLYCSLKFDPCSNNNLVKCVRLFCVDTLQKCFIQTSMSSPVSCQDLCCLGSSDSFNVNNTNSLKLCNSNLQSRSQSGSGSSNTQQTLFVGGYILIAVFASAFVLILIGFCLCKRYRSEQISAENQMNQNLNNQGNNFPPTCVDLKAYDTHKCSNCKGLANSSFTFSDEDNKKRTNEMKTQNTQRCHLNEINNEKGENKIKYQQNSDHKSRRKHRKVQSLRKVSFDSQKISEFQQRDQIDTSAKKFHPNHNKTSIGP